MAKLQDLTGMKFGELTVIERAENYILPCGKPQTMWRCMCSCGKEFTTRALQLKNGESQSCGHLQKEIVSKIAKKRKSHNEYDLTGNYGIGYTSKGEAFYFDLEDYDEIKDYHWYINKNGYLISRKSGKDKAVLFHRIVMNALSDDWKEIQIDHIHGEQSKNDNRKSNLRIATASQNGMNKKILPTNNSGVTGVFWHKKREKWIAYITVDGERKHLGYFNDIEDAKQARFQAEQKYFKDFSPILSQIIGL